MSAVGVCAFTAKSAKAVSMISTSGARTFNRFMTLRGESRASA
jgi:hypothetical protein